MNTALQNEAEVVVKALLRDPGKQNQIYYEVWRETMRPVLEQSLIYHRGNQSAAAKALGIDRQTFAKYLKKVGLIK